MPVNQTQIAVLRAGPVPPDLQCVLPQATADAIAATINVEGLASQVSGAGGVSTPITNNIGQQALLLGQANQADILVLQERIIQRRVVADRINVNPGDSVQQFSISPEMPSDRYEIRLFIEGAATHPASYYGWRVVTGSRTTVSFQVSFDNIPTGTTVTAVVEELKSIEALE